MINQVIDGINFKLQEYQDFSWLNDYGTVFSVIDETGSGCISFGIKKDNKKYSFKTFRKRFKHKKYKCSR